MNKGNLKPKTKKVIPKKLSIVEKQKKAAKRSQIIREIRRYYQGKLPNKPTWELQKAFLPVVRYEKTRENNYIYSENVKNANALKLLELDKNNVVVIEYKNNYGYRPMLADFIKGPITDEMVKEINEKIEQIKPYYDESEEPDFLRVTVFRNKKTAPRKLREGETNCFLKALNEQVKLKNKYDYEEVGEDEIITIANKEKLHIIIYDINGQPWYDYKPNKGKYTKVLFTAHNWHATTYDASKTFVKIPDNYEVTDNLDKIFKQHPGRPICDNSFNLIGNIVDDKIYKLYHDPEFPTALTKNSAVKRRFIKNNNLTPYYHPSLDQGVLNSGIFYKARKPISSDIKIDQNKSFLKAALDIPKYPIGPFEEYRTDDLYFVNNFEGIAYVNVDHGPDVTKVFNQGSGMYWFPTLRYALSLNIPFRISYVCFSRNNKPLTFPTEKSIFNPLIGSLRANNKTITIATKDENETMHFLHKYQGKVLNFKTDMDIDEKIKHILDENYDDYIDRIENDQENVYEEIINKAINYEPITPFYWVQIEGNNSSNRFPQIAGYIYAQQQINMHKIISQIPSQYLVQIWVDGIVMNNEAEPFLENIPFSDKVGDWKFEKIKNMSFQEPTYATYEYLHPYCKKLNLNPEYFPIAFNTKHVHLDAPGGFGKTYILKDLIKNLDNSIATATTNKAALDIGITTHKLLGYSFNGFLERKHHPYSTIIVDEVSMLNNELYDKLKETHPNALFIFSGDFAQLEPVKSDFIDISDFYVHELKVDFRHKDDPEFALNLKKLRNAILRNQEFDYTWFNDNLTIGEIDNEIIITHKNETVRYHNNTVAKKGSLPVNNKKCEGDIPANTMVIALKTYKAKGIVNGMVFKYLGEKSAKKATNDNCYRYEVDGEIIETKVPLEVAPYKCITAHQSQGQTFNTPYCIDVDFDAKKNPRLVYVALSRATTRHMITLTSRL